MNPIHQKLNAIVPFALFFALLFAPAATAAPAAAPGDAAPLRIYAWADYGVAGVTPMVWASVRYGHDAKPPGKGYDDARDPRVEARRAAILLLKRKPGERVLFLNGVGETPDGPFAKGLADAWLNGPDAEPTRRWCRAFFSGLRDGGVDALDYLVLDYEGGVGYWNLGDLADRKRALDALQARPELAGLPASCRAISAETFAAMDPKIVADFNARGEQLKAQFMARGIAEPLAEFFPGAPTSNWVTTATAAPTVDTNGWVEPPHPLLYGTHSSPALYANPGNRGKFAFGGVNDGSLRLAWLDARQTVRACLAGGVPAAPWYCSPRYAAAEIRDRDAAGRAADAERWADGLRCDVQAGVRVVLLWGDLGQTDPADPARFGPGDRELLRRLVPELQALASDGPVDPKLAKEPGR